MKNHPSISRRRFIQTGAGSLAALGAAQLPWRLFAAPAQDPFRGMKLGVASYSFRKFTLEQAIAMTVELGLKYISLKSFHLDLKATPAQVREARRKIEAAGLVLLGGGVITIPPKEEEVRAIFEYAKGAGMPTIVCSPVPAGLDIVEKMVVEYNIRIAIHNHGPGDKYYPLPLDAWRMVENRDKRMGICIDVGHTVRIGGDPIAAIKRCASRLYDFHLKDVTAAIPAGKHCVFGKGVIDFPHVLQTLLDVKFSGHLEMEYEDTPDDPLPGMKESVAYLRKVFATLT
ncbi:MAG: sugar phosphate isomerase/epimerase [Opitutus sp.]|nr:sugar phosphate isomerase/epimerase [Opitutus sp.]